MKDKLFYFGNIEYNPLGQIDSAGDACLAPTAGGYSILAGVPGISKTNLAVLQKYLPAAGSNDGGLYNGRRRGHPVGNVSFNSPSYTNSYNALVSLDSLLSDKDQIRGRWIYNKSVGLQTPASLPAFNLNSPNNNYLFPFRVSQLYAHSAKRVPLLFSRNVNYLGVPNITFPGMMFFP